MWKAAVLATCLLLAGVRAMDGPTYGVKLCGREFIRAVIFTCGGSRWRRSIMSTDDLPLDPFGTEDREATDGWVLPAGPETLVQQGVEASSLGLSRSRQEGAMFSRPARSLISEEVLEALRTSSRKGRDVVVGLSNACCKWGCSKSEISSLC
ncbi:relaxin-3a [Salminus brasiliensis]|uniref:relaxin-3a n=1 Tax=Salminus brasiliensis TaxID=930266 RepID=UPI003B836E11